MKPKGVFRCPFVVVSVFTAILAPVNLHAQWTGLGAGGVATDASDPANYSASLGDFSGNNADAVINLTAPTIFAGINLNYLTVPRSLTINGDGVGPSEILTLGGDITFTRPTLPANNSSFTLGSDVTLDLDANRAIVGSNAANTGTFAITFNGAVTSSAVGNQRLSISSGTPNVFFNGNVTLDGGLTLSAGNTTVSVGSILNLTGGGANSLESTGGATAHTILGQFVSDGGVSVSGATLILSNATNSYSGNHVVSAGTLRGSDGVGIKSGNILLSGGVYEETGGSFTRAIGTGTNQVQLTGGTTGFSARDTALAVNLGGGTVVWGSTGFNPASLVLNGFASNATLDFQNAIDLNGGGRQIFVNTGSAVTLSGVISGNAASGMTLNSQSGGFSTFRLTNTNEFTGRTVIANVTGGATANTEVSVTQDRNLGATPTTAYLDNIILAVRGQLTAAETFTLNANRGIGIGNSSGGTVTGAISVSTGKTLTYSGNIANRTLNIGGGASVANTGTFQKLGAGALNLYGENSSYTGATFLSGGTTRVVKLSDGGLAGSFGAGGVAADQFSIGAARLQYVGRGDTTNRLFNISGDAFLDSSGTGALQFSSTGTITASTGSNRILTLTGSSKDANTIAGGIANPTGNTTAIVKNGSGNWTLSGTNTFTGSTRSNGGSLILDYSGNGNTADPLSTGGLILSGADVTFRGRTSGATTETVSALTLASSTTSGGLNRLFVNSNGGTGIGLTVSSLVGSSQPQAATLIDLSSSSGNTVNVNALGGGIAAVSTGTAGQNILMSNQNRAQVIVRDSSGYGFGTLSTASAQNLSTPNATIGRLTAGTNLASVAAGTATSIATDYFLSTSTTRAVALNFRTLTIDSTSGPITLSMGTNNVGSSDVNAFGRGILVSGANDVTFARGASGNFAQTGANSIFLHHYGTGKLTIQQNLIAGTPVFSGTGLIDTTGSIADAANLLVQGNVFRMSGGTNVAAFTNAGSGFTASSGGVFEIGSDLNAGTAGDLTNSIGAIGNGRFNFLGDSGVSAFGGDRVVNFGIGTGAGSSQNLVWGTSNFLTTTESTPADGDFSFKLSSQHSDSTVTVQNNIDFNARNRTFDVANGSKAVDAVLSGVLGGAEVGLTKAGLGALTITNTNTYTGITRVTQGILTVSGGGINSTTGILAKDATLSLASANVLNDSSPLTLDNGRLITNGNAETVGALTIFGNNQLDLAGAGNLIRFADSSTAIWGSTLTIGFWDGLSTGGGSDQVFFGANANGLTSGQLSSISFLNPIIDGFAQTGSFAAGILGNGEVIAVIPEPSSLLLVTLGSLGLVLRRRRN